MVWRAGWPFFILYLANERASHVTPFDAILAKSGLRNFPVRWLAGCNERNRGLWRGDFVGEWRDIANKATLHTPRPCPRDLYLD